MRTEEDLGTFQDPTDVYSRVALPFLVDPGDQTWKAKSACLGSGLDFFDGFAKEEAKAVCATCKVREDCLSFALRNGEQWGVWGGLDANERAALSKVLA